MNEGIKKILFAKFLVEYVGDYEYNHLDANTISKIRNQDVFILVSQSPSDYEFLVASKRMSFPCNDGNLVTLYPYYELLCMYSELGFWKKFCYVLHHLDVERSLPETIESNDDYFDPLYMYYTKSSIEGYDVFDVEDDYLIGHCEYPGGPIDKIAAPTCKRIEVDPFEKVLDRYLEEHADRYFPERQSYQLEEGTEDDAISNCESFYDKSLERSLVQNDCIELIEQIPMPLVEYNAHSNVSIDVDVEDYLVVDLDSEFSVVKNVTSKINHIFTKCVLSLSAMKSYLTDFSHNKIYFINNLIKDLNLKFNELNLFFCSEKDLCPCYWNSRLIKTRLNLTGLDISLIRRSFVV